MLRLKGRPVVVPGVDLAGMTDEQRDRAMARWLFEPAKRRRIMREALSGLPWLGVRAFGWGGGFVQVHCV